MRIPITTLQGTAMTEQRVRNNVKLSIPRFQFLSEIIRRILRPLWLCLTNPKKIISFINLKKQSVYNSQLNRLWSEQNYILANLPKSNSEFYHANKHIVELEHQVGRYLNMKDIITEIKKDDIDGDVLEFGTWQGLSLLIINLCFGKHNRKLIGIDSFEGLPETSTIWKKGDFNNTTLNLAQKNIATNSSNKESFKLIKGWFNDKSVSDSLYKETNNLALIHFDADLGSSTTEALKIIEPYLKDRSKPIYFLFDDWGCHPDEVPDAFVDWLKSAQITYKLKALKMSSTRYTRYYKVIFN